MGDGWAAGWASEDGLWVMRVNQIPLSLFFLMDHVFKPFSIKFKIIVNFMKENVKQDPHVAGWEQLVLRMMEPEHGIIG
jgi:hypothetical protein